MTLTHLILKEMTLTPLIHADPFNWKNHANWKNQLDYGIEGYADGILRCHRQDGHPAAGPDAWTIF